MNAVIHCALAQLEQRLKGSIDHLIVSASYEERAFGIWNMVVPFVGGRKIVCFNRNHAAYLDESVERFRLEDEHAECVGLDSDDPLLTFEALRGIFDSLRGVKPVRVAIDVTGFTREALAILIYLAKHRLPAGSVITVLYHKASGYGRSPGSGWLSQGVREVRSVLGYAGLVRISADTHLVLLAGFEFERAQEIIDAVQPSRISLGQVTAENSVSTRLNEILESFMERLEAFYAGTTFDRFDFSSIDPFFTRDSVLDLTRDSKSNVVVACLNSKPATIGVCLAAMEYPAIQKVYAQPLCYNVTDYSLPSGLVLFFEVPV